jgi:hypothetical protein
LAGKSGRSQFSAGKQKHLISCQKLLETGAGDICAPEHACVYKQQSVPNTPFMRHKSTHVPVHVDHGDAVLNLFELRLHPCPLHHLLLGSRKVLATLVCDGLPAGISHVLLSAIFPPCGRTNLTCSPSHMTLS